MKKSWNKWVWYAVLVAVVCGLFGPTMVANALSEVDRARCPGPATGDVQ
ncbi:MAG: hypothetical protein IT366_13450 [Candidatus Hydrogenedentes bacterium]|nr:hypothetical protein [Candidatus Hydrogenedentota bacterium]